MPLFGFDRIPVITASYEQLMSQYVWLLESARSRAKGWRGPLGWLRRVLIEDHIRVKLRDLAQAFTLHGYVFSDPASPDLSDWFQKEAEYLNKIADSLPDFKKQYLEWLWKGLLALFGTAFLKVITPIEASAGLSPGIKDALDALFTLIFSGSLVLFGIFVALPLLGLFLVFFKRDLLLPGHDRYGKLIDGETPQYNVYRLEDDLYKALERKKPPEDPWDIWAMSLLLFACVTIFLYLILNLPELAPAAAVKWGFRGLLLIAGGGLAYILFLEIVRLSKRDG